MIDRRSLSELERRTGLRLGGGGERRVAQVTRDAGPRAGGALERDDVVAALTVGETYFFRDPRQFELLRAELLPEAARRRAGAPVEVWSAGCATGEEAYTVAMTAAEAGLARRVRVLGTDLNPRAVAAAEAARYRPWALRGMAEVRRRAWFEADGETYRVRDAIRRRVRFAAANLLDGPPGRFDVVLCRNVLIYFTAEAIDRTAAVLRDALRPGGWLITGASDPLMRAPGLVVVRTAMGLAYRRGEQPPVRRDAPPARRGTRRPDVGTASVEPAVRSPERSSSATEGSLDGEDIVERAESLGAAGRRAEALALAVAAVAADPLDPRLRHLAALLHLEAGDADAAADAARAAVFLAPDFAVAHLVLGQAEQGRGRAAAARRAFRSAARLLAALDPDEPVDAAGGELAGRLAVLAARLAEEGDDGS